MAAKRDRVRNPRCPVCHKEILRGDRVVSAHGDLYHVTCWEKRAGQPKK